MELPQLTLYLRRMLASPRGLGCREALRTPRVRALLLILGCVVGTTLQQYVTLRLHDQTINLGTLALWDLPQYSYFLLGLCGVWAILFLAADQMGSLALQSRRAPDWHSAPLASASALASAALAALLAALPAVLSLALFIALAGSSLWFNAFHDDNIPPAVITGARLVQLICMLPVFCLASGSLLLAVRHSALAPYLPALLACGGAVLSTTPVHYVPYALRADYYEQFAGGPSPPGAYVRCYLALLGLSLGLAALLGWVLAELARRQVKSSRAPLLGLALVMLPAAVAVVAYLPRPVWNRPALLYQEQLVSLQHLPWGALPGQLAGLVYPTSFPTIDPWVPAGGAFPFVYALSLVLLPVIAAGLWFGLCVRTLDCARGMAPQPLRRALKKPALSLAR